MSEEKVVVVEQVEKIEEVAPAVPTTAPPAEEVTEVKVEEPKVEEKVEEPPADIREEPLKWLGQQIPPAVHKVNYLILDYIQTIVEEDPEKRAALPGKNEAVTKNQFINHLKDGELLAKLANVFTPGAVEKVHEGEELKVKENQKANREAFVNWAKTRLPEDQVFAAEDLEKGKPGYQAVFSTLWQLATQATEKFSKDSIDTDAVVEAAGQAVKTSIIDTILNFFKRARPQTSQSAKQAAMEAEEKERAEKAEKVVEEEAVKVEVVAPTSPAVVAAN
ncbi:unnamed protein product, partial [Mesorhabditis spiculigera]